MMKAAQPFVVKDSPSRLQLSDGGAVVEIDSEGRIGAPTTPAVGTGLSDIWSPDDDSRLDELRRLAGLADDEAGPDTSSATAGELEPERPKPQARGFSLAAEAEKREAKAAVKAENVARVEKISAATVARQGEAAAKRKTERVVICVGCALVAVFLLTQ